MRDKWGDLQFKVTSTVSHRLENFLVRLLSQKKVVVVKKLTLKKCEAPYGGHDDYFFDLHSEKGLVKWKLKQNGFSFPFFFWPLISLMDKKEGKASETVLENRSRSAGHEEDQEGNNFIDESGKRQGSKSSRITILWGATAYQPPLLLNRREEEEADAFSKKICCNFQKKKTFSLYLPCTIKLCFRHGDFFNI